MSYSSETLTPATSGLSVLSPKTILVAEHSGFCHGVKRAVEQTLEVADTQQAKPSDKTKPVYVLGQLIHNPQEIERIAAQGIITVQSLDEVPPGSVCVIRTHGAAPELVEAAEAKGIEVSDATCPDVRLVQNKAIQLAEEGYTVVVVGKEDHPEVIGITAYAQRVPHARIVCINRVEDVQDKLKDLPRRRVGVVSQTTQMEETFFQMVKELSKMAKELKVFNTICPATYFRQNAAQQLARQVEFMVVIGGKNSSNTTHLADICREQGTQTVHIETYRELDACAETCAKLSQARVIGVTAGASTPAWLVDEVIQYLQSL